ncbi:LOW QUALITY PROTEIN: uncharacterized protein LOC121374491 [Gigantopelta aegis]|uniref:LOW QUALITY PROTEIN: uncharacterized protein LOC121374491 n=1 Tax=Gigantopelta aegis TaxID=1735272 RepID=UPI001B88A04B|nr:LOW QUALITY PROTEIN: uncharacterized protein LOC121374491 [Gigantopelta aegis]
MDILNQEIQTTAPFIHRFMSTLVKASPVGIPVATAVALRFRNTHISAFHHIIAQVLDHGGATDETIIILNKLGLCVSTSATAVRKKALQQKQMEDVSSLMSEEKKHCESFPGTSIHTLQSADIIGDNIDISRTPSQMSVDRRNKSFHWFLLVDLEKRVLNTSLDDSAPIADISHIDNSSFVQNLKDCDSLDKNFIFHIMHILVKYVDCLKKYAVCLPTVIPHPHLSETSKKSDFAILDLLDKSENKSEDMISILEHIHEKYIPRTGGENPTVIRKKVFGGDVLTNERAYSAQLAMLNGKTDFERLTGVVHRPEGLHRMMNLLLFIYQKFYKQNSALDKGTLFYLRNVVGRTNVSGANEVIANCSPHPGNLGGSKPTNPKPGRHSVGGSERTGKEGLRTVGYSSSVGQ